MLAREFRSPPSSAVGTSCRDWKTTAVEKPYASSRLSTSL